MKTRIKIVTLRNGEQDFYPQHRFLGVWFTFRGFSYDCICREVFGSLKGAQGFLDNQYKEIERRKNMKVALTQYVKYP